MFPSEKWRLLTYCNPPTHAYPRKWEHLKNHCSAILLGLTGSQLHRLHLANITKETASLHRHFWQSDDVPKFTIVRAGILVNSLYFDVFGTSYQDLGDISNIFKTLKIDLKWFKRTPHGVYYLRRRDIDMFGWFWNRNKTSKGCENPVSIALLVKSWGLENVASSVPIGPNLCKQHRLHLANITKETTNLHLHFWLKYGDAKFVKKRAGIVVELLYSNIEKKLDF